MTSVALADYLISSGSSVKEAMKQLDRTARKTLFVVGANGRLAGSLSDGDIRRWILSGGDLNDEVAKACFRSPLTARKGEDRKNLKEEILRRRISCVPVLDDDDEVVDVLDWDVLVGGQIERKAKGKIDIPVVIMAGGLGSRLDPFTKILPKALIPIGEKTIIETIIDRFREYGVDRFFVSINYKAKVIKAYFEDLNPAYGITYLYEDEPLGTAGGLASLSGLIAGPFLITNCDILLDADYADLVEFHRKNNHDITLVASVKHFHIPYGICEIKNGGELIGISEKPEYSFLVNAGMYVIDSALLGLIPRGEVFHMTQFIEKAQAEGKRIGIYPVGEKAWIDVGEWAEYKNALARLL
ncbi:MAG TPA: nucleotidyltransferase [Deltaproteobacteria bacterium]|nr:nucleotidyltransferase [Deltaproteobacteria bacterium]